MKIKKIRSLGKQKTYNLTMKDPYHNYLINNKITQNSHAVSYALISYQTAFLKANFPIAYMAALLSNENDDDKKLEYKKECQIMGIQLLPPNVQSSSYLYEPTTENSIQRDLASIKRVGSKAVKIIQEKQPFKDINEFLMSIDGRTVNKTSLGNLCKAGALDCFGIDRRNLIDYLVDYREKLKAFVKKGGNPGDFEYNFPSAIPLSLEERMNYEFEATGEYISGNKSDIYTGFFNQERNIKYARDLQNMCNNALINMELIVNRCRMKRPIKEGRNQGKLWAIYEMEDVWGDIVNIIMWPTQLEKFGKHMTPGEAIKIEGQVSVRNDESSDRQVKIRKIKDTYSAFKERSTTVSVTNQGNNVQVTLETLN
jgi:DNA polymerase-3 subunit alpha